MRPGDLVEFKSGTFGIQAPKNLGLYLDRAKHKGDYFVVLWTVQGRREFKRDRVGRVLLSSRLPPDVLADESSLGARLADLMREAQKGVHEDARRALEEARDRDLWQKLDGASAEMTVAELARAYFGREPQGPQIAAVRAVLESCQRPGVGYFERLPGRDERWRPLSRDEYRRVVEDREGLRQLRNKLVESREVEEDGRVRTVYVGRPPDAAGLSDADRARLAFLKELMVDFILHDRLSKPWGVGGTSVHTIDGWRLFDEARFLALDWTGSRATVSSAFVEFLIATGQWTPRDALETLAKRKVMAEGTFRWDMDERAVREAAHFPDAIPAEEVARRADLRGVEFYTIDPPDAKDHDDTVAVEARPDGTWLLRVAIADVSHYVRPGTLLDRMARDRATSLYLPTGVLPMLPPRLSEDLCSLVAGVDRLALTAEIEYSAAGEIVAERFLDSVIHVRKVLDYATVEAAIGRGEEPYATLDRLAKLLQSRRRGLALDSGEVRITLTPDAVAHHVKYGTVATQMIEAFMVAANEAVARHLASRGVALLYRCHPLPDRSSVARFNAQVRAMGLPVAITLPEPSAEEKEEDEGPSVLDLLKGGKSLTLMRGGFQVERDAEEAPPAADAAPAAPILKGLAQLPEPERDAWVAPFRAGLATVHALADRGHREIVELKLLSCLGRALYTPDNLGHFGLASACYAHFTSPIRRYPDLIVHRQLRAVLTATPPPHAREDLLTLAGHCSDQGSLAEDIERTVVQVALLLEERSAARPWPRPGLVNGVAKKGIFVSLGQGLEARVFPGDIPGGPYSVDENDAYLFAGLREQEALAGEIDFSRWREYYEEDLKEVVRVKLRLGDSVGVTAAGFDYVDGRIVCRLAE